MLHSTGGHLITLVLQLMFAFWELARQPEIQDRLREEITEMYEAIKAQGNEDFTSEDIDNMSFTNAVVKVSPARTLRNRVLMVIQEVLRCHAPVIELERVTWKDDDVLPLKRPMVGRSGKVYQSLPVPKGTTVNVSLWGYNL